MTGEARDLADFLDAFYRLSPENRQILLLINVAGLNYEETAAELNIPLGAVPVKLARARERLRAALEGEQAQIIPWPGRRVR